MARKEAWDFECPQYVNFDGELDDSGKVDVFFESSFSEEVIRNFVDHNKTKITKRRYIVEKVCAEDIDAEKEHEEKSSEIKSLCTPEVQGKGKGLTESDENRLLGKMTAALSLLENTPKVKKSASRGKLFAKSVSKNISANITKSAVKLHTVPAACPKTRLSRSLDHINKIATGQTAKGKCGLRKSSSLNDLRTNNKLKYPITPMCLKRTIFKAKEKIRKTTEEMELEQIAKLQKQLILHLRQNEISLRRLNLRPRQCTTSKVVPKPDNSKDLKGRRTCAGKSQVTEKELRKTVHILNQISEKKEASKLETAMNSENASYKKTKISIYSQKSKALSVPSAELDTSSCVQNQAALKEKDSRLNAIINNETECDKKTYPKKTKAVSVSSVDSKQLSNKAPNQKTRKTIYNRIMDHSGLMFVPSVKSNTTVKPFIFEAKAKEMKLQTAESKQKEKSVLHLKDNDDKENSFCIRTQPGVKKTHGTQNAKYINKLAESSKTSLNRSANPLRGVPLAENISRN